MSWYDGLPAKVLARFQEEIAVPLNADFHIGVPESEFSRIGRLIPAGDGGGPSAEDDSIAARTFASPFAPATESWTEVGAALKFPLLTAILMREQSPDFKRLCLQGFGLRGRLVSKETAESVMQAEFPARIWCWACPLLSV